MTRRADLITNRGTVIPLDSGSFLLGTDVPLFGLPKVSVTSERMPGVAGAKVRARRHETRDLFVPLLILADSATAFDRAVADLSRGLDPVVGDVRLRMHRDDGTAREIQASYVDGLSGLSLAWSGARETEARIVLEAHDPYWQAVSDSELEIVTSEFEGGGEPTSWNADISWNANIAWNGVNASGVQEMTLTIASDVDVWPRWEVKGPGTALLADSSLLSQHWAYEGTLVTGDRLTVDTAPGVRRVSLNDVNAWGSMSDDTNLWPLRPGANLISLRLREWEPGVSRVRLIWRERYLTC